MTFIRRKLGDLTAAFLCQVPYQRFCDPESGNRVFPLCKRPDLNHMNLAVATRTPDSGCTAVVCGPLP